MLYIKVKTVLKKAADSGITSENSIAKIPKMTNTETNGIATIDEIIPFNENELSIKNWTGTAPSCAPAETERSSLSFSAFLGKLPHNKALIFGLKKIMPNIAE